MNFRHYEIGNSSTCLSRNTNIKKTLVKEEEQIESALLKKFIDV